MVLLCVCLYSHALCRGFLIRVIIDQGFTVVWVSLSVFTCAFQGVSHQGDWSLIRVLLHGVCLYSHVLFRGFLIRVIIDQGFTVCCVSVFTCATQCSELSSVWNSAVNCWVFHNLDVTFSFWLNTIADHQSFELTIYYITITECKVKSFFGTSTNMCIFESCILDCCTEGKKCSGCS